MGTPGSGNLGSFDDIAGLEVAQEGLEHGDASGYDGEVESSLGDYGWYDARDGRFGVSFGAEINDSSYGERNNAGG